MTPAATSAPAAPSSAAASSAATAAAEVANEAFALDDAESGDDGYVDDADAEKLLAGEGGEHSQQFTGLVEMEVLKRKLLCLFCGQNSRAKNQVYCNSPCGADVKSATKAAKARGDAHFKAFMAVKKRGGAAFQEAIHVYRAQCAGSGRGFTRPSFDWVRYQIISEVASRIQSGTRSVWLNKSGFIAFETKSRGGDPTAAAAEFERQKLTLSADRVNGDEILWPIERFVVTMEEESHLEQCISGYKDKRKPSAEDIAQIKNVMGTDHRSFEDMSQPMGLGKGAVNDHEKNKMARSTAPTDPHQKRLLEEANISEMKAAAEKKVAAKAKSADKKKKFDVVAKRSVLDPEFSEMGLKLVERATEMMDKAQHTVDSVEKNQELGKMFETAINTLKHRLECLAHASCIAQEGGDPIEPDASRADDHRTKFDAFLRQEHVRKPFDDNKEPYEFLMEMLTLSQVLQQLQTYRIESDEDVKSERKRLKGVRDMFLGLIQKVSEQNSRLAHSFKKKLDSQVESEVKTRLKKEAEAADSLTKESAEKRLAQKKSKGAVAAVKKYTVLSIPDDFEEFLPVPTVVAIDGVDQTKPFVVKMQLDLGEQVKADVQAFTQAFPKDKTYGGSGRGSKVLDKGIDFVNGQIRKFFAFGNKIQPHISAAENNFLMPPWVYGYSSIMKACGPEYGYLSSLKVSLSGSRRVRLAPIHGLYTFIQSTRPAGSPVTMKDMSLLLSEAAQNVLKAMSHCGLKVMSCVVQGGEALYVPTGWAIAECTINGSDSFGLRWLLANDKSTQNLGRMMSVLIPDGAPAPKQNTAHGFLLKLVQAQGRVLKDPDAVKFDVPSLMKMCKKELQGDNKEPPAKKAKT